MTAWPGWAGAAAGAWMVMMATWLGPVELVAQQREGVPAPPPALSGDVARGRYLVERVAMCGECHSSRDQAGVIVPETRLKGGPLPIRMPWTADPPVQVPRIAGLPGYSDVEALRVLTQGAVKRNGLQARAPMPRFRMTPEDAADVIAFLRSQ